MFIDWCAGRVYVCKCTLCAIVDWWTETTAEADRDRANHMEMQCVCILVLPCHCLKPAIRNVRRTCRNAGLGALEHSETMFDRVWAWQIAGLSASDVNNNYDITFSYCEMRWARRAKNAVIAVEHNACTAIAPSTSWIIERDGQTATIQRMCRCSFLV